MKRPLSLLSVLLVLAGTAAGCGGSSEDPDMPQGGSEGRAMAASDVEVVADALRTIRVTCVDGANPATLVAPARAIASQAVRYPNEVFESGDADRALQMKTLVGELAGSLRDCKAPEAASILDRAKKQTASA